jgi:glycosyltransferase involved in cell wall biosynthesis
MPVVPIIVGEPLSRVLLEAFGVWRADCGDAYGTAPEIVCHGRSGILAPDTASFVAAAQRLHNDPAWRQQIQAGASLRAQQLFDTNVVIKHVLQLL